jgi:hemerythrin-like domain-containing protein
LRRSALDLLDHEHRMQEHLCDILEKIADGLPQDTDPGLCRQAVQALRHDIPLHHRDEEAGLFPLLNKYAAKIPVLTEAIQRLEHEHDSDEALASEIIEQLEILAQGRHHGNADMLGYMLRAFFEGYRRHIHWEDAVIMPLARAHLSAADLKLLDQEMAKNRAQVVGYHD